MVAKRAADMLEGKPLQLHEVFPLLRPASRLPRLSRSIAGDKECSVSSDPQAVDVEHVDGIVFVSAGKHEMNLIQERFVDCP